MEELKKSKGDANGGIRDKENGKIEGCVVLHFTSNYILRLNYGQPTVTVYNRGSTG